MRDAESLYMTGKLFKLEEEEEEEGRGLSEKELPCLCDLCCVFGFALYLCLQMFLPVVLSMALAGHRT